MMKLKKTGIQNSPCFFPGVATQMPTYFPGRQHRPLETPNMLETNWLALAVFFGPTPRPFRNWLTIFCRSAPGSKNSGSLMEEMMHLLEGSFDDL